MVGSMLKGKMPLKFYILTTTSHLSKHIAVNTSQRLLTYPSTSLSTLLEGALLEIALPSKLTFNNTMGQSQDQPVKIKGLGSLENHPT